MILSFFMAIVCALSIESATMGVEKVVASKSFETSNTIVVAVLTEPIFSHLEINEVKEKITIAIREAGFTKQIIVTLDIDVYSKIKNEMSIEQKTKLLEIVKGRQ